MIDRAKHRNQWMHDNMPYAATEMIITALPGDASFRKYFRINTPEKNYLLVDAPPESENSHRFVTIATAYRQQQIITPLIFSQDLTNGFLLIEDFGHQVLANVLDVNNADKLYRQCYQLLPNIHLCHSIDDEPLPKFIDDLLDMELMNFKRWSVIEFSGLTLSKKEEQLLYDAFAKIKQKCAEQPQVGVHRDYHSRNLMILADEKIGVIDFQDAVIGPITYDLVSLLRDCYVSWPEEQVNYWVKDYYQSFADQSEYSLAQFEQWFDWQGIQRHCKAIFIFCRKFLRDHSANYLNDIPRTLNYIFLATKKYPELRQFHQWLETRLAPPLLQRIEKILR
jgi:aminoglycoside/choline kinase family phosphotransferase